MKPHQRIILALDACRGYQAEDLVNDLHDYVGMFKVGPEILLSAGSSFLQWAQYHQVPIMLDLKLHDIPETVKRSIAMAGEYGVKFCTIHVQQPATLIAAKEEADKAGITLLGITLLTSISESDCQILYNMDSNSRVLYLANLAMTYDIPGLVCSPAEVAMLRARSVTTTLVVPGIRLPEDDHNDQCRTGTPQQAIKDGADYLVIGRPIRNAISPKQAAKLLAQHIQGDQSSKDGSG
jgi:orotidine-5'-phosphate decarboxylase